MRSMNKKIHPVTRQSRPSNGSGWVISCVVEIILHFEKYWTLGSSKKNGRYCISMIEFHIEMRNIWNLFEICILYH